MLSVCLYLPVFLHNGHPLRDLPLKSLLECCDTGIFKGVRVPDIVRMVDVQVLCHRILLVLPHDGSLVLSKAMDRVVPGLPVVLGQHVGGGALLACDQVLDT